MTENKKLIQLKLFQTTPGPRTATVVRLRRELKTGKILQSCDVYIGRTVKMGGWDLECSKWHNPYRLSDCNGDIDECLRRFEEYLVGNKELMAALPELKGKVLGCWCKNKPSDKCHGDVLVKYVNKITAP